MSGSPLSSRQKQDTIDEAAARLAEALKGSDYTTVETTLAKVRKLAYPPLTEQEKYAESRVLDARAAQRAVALFRTESRLYSDEAQRTAQVLKKLERSAIWLENQDFVHSVIDPVKQEYEQQLQLAESAAQTALEKEDEFVRLRREAHTAVASLMTREERQYRQEFQAALSHVGGKEAAEQVYEILSRFEERSRKENLHPKQPVPEGLEPSSPKYLAWLRKEAQEAIDIKDEPPLGFSSLVHNLASECNGRATIAPLKGYERTVQKTQDKYGGDSSKVLDLVRGMVVFDNIPDLAKALELLETYGAENRVEVLRAKDRLSTHFNASQHAGGYRDVLLNIRLNGNSEAPLVTELQLHLTSFLKIKNDRGHVNYEAARNIHMFNPAFTTRSFLWEPDADESEVEELLTDIRTGIISNLKLDYSTALWGHAAKERLAEAFGDLRCNCKEISLRSCRCGDEFILTSISEEYLASLPEDLPPITSTVRLGSVIHEGTAGRISSVGISRLLSMLNDSLCVLDLEGCLDMDWYENCGDEVAETFVKHVDETIAKGKQPLPQFYELNLKSTGLTERGMAMLKALKEDGKVPQLKVLHDDDLTKPPRPVGPHRRPAVKKDESVFLRSSQISDDGE